MNPIAPPCPNETQLLAFRDGRLPQEQLQRIAQHLDACSHCSSAVQGLHDTVDPLLAELRLDFQCDPPLETECRRVVARVAGIGHSTPQPPSVVPETMDLPPALPRTLGGFELLEELGEGGMGKVYKARQKTLGRIVAVKVLTHHRLTSAAAGARFRQEMLAAGQLDHPHVVRALHAEVEDVPYLAMEYVEGVNLARLLKDHGPLPVAAACELIRQAALGLQHAHENGLVHRDIKPSNLMLTTRGLVKVLDLGLARLRAEEQPADAGLTGTGMVMGTPDYMAPEQLLDAHAVDIRADIYSLGCTLYELLTGAAPFSGPSYSSLMEKRQAHLTTPPPPLSEHRPEVPAELADVVARMIAKLPEQRYATPAEVVDALQPFTHGCQLEGMALTSAPASAAQRETQTPNGSTAPMTHPPQRFWTRRRFVAASLGGLAVLGGGIATWRSSWQAPPLRIIRFEVTHYRADGDRTIPVLPRDGLPLHAVQLYDYVRVSVELSAKAACYLIAFNPNGKDQLCYPFLGEQGGSPQPVSQLTYPRGDKFFKLDDGVGLQAFVLLVSRQSLPPYDDWKRRMFPLPQPWQAVIGEGEWRFDGETFEPLSLGQRGSEVQRPVPATFVELCRRLRERNEDKLLEAVVFPVREPAPR